MTSRALRTVAFEAHEMSVERHQELAARAEGVTLVPFGRKIEDLARHVRFSSGRFSADRA